MLTVIDYAKAFNRLSFQHCLEAFARKGASTEMIRILATFLSNRTMLVRINATWSAPLLVYGGVPQGSILGVLLFNVSTDDLEDEEHDARCLVDSSTSPPSGGSSEGDSLISSQTSGTTHGGLPITLSQPPGESSPWSDSDLLTSSTDTRSVTRSMSRSPSEPSDRLVDTANSTLNPLAEPYVPVALRVALSARVANITDELLASLDNKPNGDHPPDGGAMDRSPDRPTDSTASLAHDFDGPCAERPYATVGTPDESTRFVGD